MIDCSKLPIPKYKVGDKVWVVAYGIQVKEAEIECVEIKLTWFDNGYTSRQEYKVTYEINGYNYQVEQIYNSKRTAQRVLAREKIESRQINIEQLKRDFKSLEERCSLYGLSIEDL